MIGELKNVLEGSDHGLIEMSWHLPGKTEENHENRQSV
jgi:hypothetical protein